MARREGPAESKLDSCEQDGELLQLEEYDLEEEDTSYLSGTATGEDNPKPRFGHPVVSR